MKKLRGQIRSHEKKLHRLQKNRGRIREMEKWLRGHGFKVLADRADATQKKLHRRIDGEHRELRKLNKKLDAIVAAREDDKADFVKWINGKVGVDENSAEMKAWARAMGADPSWAWCSTFVGYGLSHVGGFAGKMPSGVPYSGTWLNWSYGTRVSYSQRQPGDLLIFDWGDGGMTDHVAVYVGNNQMVGGNQRDTNSGGQVSKITVPASNIVGVVRPKWDD